MVNLVNFKLIQVDQDRDFLLVNILISIATIIISGIIISFMVGGTTTSEFWCIGIILLIFLIILLYRSLIAVSFGSKIKEIDSTVLSNKSMISLIILFGVDIILIFYAIFYYQIRETVPPQILDVIIAPIIIIAVISLIIVGIENFVYSFGIGIFTLTLFINSADVHHTMGEYILIYSFTSSLLLSSFYLLPGILLGIVFANSLHTKDLKVKTIKLALLSFIPLVFIFFLHLILFSYVFSNWSSL